MAEGIYHGRLQCDGMGNLLADNPDDPNVHGQPVAYHEGSYVFLSPGEDSHNKRHENNAVEMTGTVDETMTDDPSLVNATPDGDNAHHFDSVDPDAMGDYLPDAQSAKLTGHTDAWGDNG